MQEHSQKTETIKNVGGQHSRTVDAISPEAISEKQTVMLLQTAL